MHASVLFLAVCCLLNACCSAPVRAAEAAPAARAKRHVVDPAVVPAGGICHGCREPHCRTCHHGRLHHHHPGCRDGACHPYCPVRPQEFGFYGTQWRRWPGQGVVPVAASQEATPALPPKSAVPGPDEESRGPRAAELPAPEAEQPAAENPPAGPAEPLVPEQEPAKLPPVERPARPATEEPIAPAPPAAEPPADAPPANKKTDADDVFDESATGPVRRRLIARRPAAAADETPAAVRPVGLTYPASVAATEPPPADTGRKPGVPRVPFDPAVDAPRSGR